MGIKHLWDTNTAIYYLQQQFPPNAEKFIDDLLKDNIDGLKIINPWDI